MARCEDPVSVSPGPASPDARVGCPALLRRRPLGLLLLERLVEQVAHQ